MLLFSIIAREFRQAARNRQMHGTRLLFGLFMTAWFVVAAYGEKLTGASAAGRLVYDSVVFPLAYGLMFLAAALGAPLLVQERKDGTLQLLFLSHLGAGEIVMAKFGAKIIEGLLLILLVLPLISLAILWGGIHPPEVMGDMLILLSVLLLSTASGIWASSFCRKPITAVLLAVGLVFIADLLLSIFVNAPIRTVAAMVWADAASAYEPGHGLFNLSCLLLGPNSTELQGGAVNLLLSLLPSGILLALAMRNLSRRRFQDECDLRQSPRRGISDSMRAFNLLAAFLFAGLILFANTEHLKPRTIPGILVAANPLLSWIGNVILMCSIVLSVHEQKKSGELEILVSTPVSSAQILWRPFVQAWKSCWGWYLLFHAVEMMWIVNAPVYDSSSTIAAVVKFAGQIVDFFVVAAVATFPGSRERRLTPAIVLALLLFGVIGRLPFSYKPYAIDRFAGDFANTYLSRFEMWNSMSQAHVMLGQYILSFSATEICLMIVSVLISIGLLLITARKCHAFAARQ